jgi:hypothetical protein
MPEDVNSFETYLTGREVHSSAVSVSFNSVACDFVYLIGFEIYLVHEIMQISI